ncbi:DNA helicase UvrD [Thioclava sp. L04-15]|uniref:UvrD-helicase domain-containing protein n=1 Tax=Thioclava sp. L04-15 TaxID=1915318 RepID=UPI00099806E7|nr:UvrD-helicase domain-containing protein [Thioclava sp. L04-15]OOY26471.1 DNA helicase UvrD [Thioclava sp. L04-15]TNE90575.1 MAG: DNA helicase UvrD [Paracoccaceae bacterium]
MTKLSLVPAGAGAGKTYHIQKTLGDWVETGEVAPGRILAVTFTEAAAAEMRDRVRGELMARGRLHDALDVDRAYIGTIHALGQRLLTEHAFAAGRSPNSRLLSEPERDLFIRLEMSRCAVLEPVMEDLARFGYAWDFLTQSSAEDEFRADVLKTVDLIRSLGARGLSSEILKPALDALTEGYGPVEPNGAALTATLQGAVRDLLDAFPESLASQFAETKTVRDAFAKDHRLLRKATLPGGLEKDWSLWQNLRKLRVSNSKTKTPDGYDTLAEAVIEAANALPRHPGPLSDAQAHLNALVTGAQQVLAAYEAAKRKAGLIDYADMIAETEALLRTRPEILQSVLGEIDCVVIDEFQDTNSVQFAMLWRLARGAKSALIVGDTKQSIMGFQGADPRLSDALQAARPDTVTPLYRNWRSDARIMEMVNALGPTLFDHYEPLIPQRGATGETALEVLHLPKGRKDTTPESIANRVSDILEAGARVWDKTRKVMRPARPSDVAVLTYTHAKASAAAAALEAHGLPVRIQQDGWLTSPVMRAARAALAYAADSDDLNAALTWLTLGPPRVPLEDALRNSVDGVLGAHVSLTTLQSLNESMATRPVADTVAAVLHAGALRDWAAGLAQPAQALADLARLESEAQEFDTMALDLRSAAGFHGAGLQVFLGWIAGQSAKDWDRHPDPDGWSSSGIEICTWHAAKGREWPIAVVAGLDKKIAERPGTMRGEFDGFDDLDNVLDHAGLGYLPDFAAPESQAPFAEARRPEDERCAARELYVALTRARDRLIIVLPRERTKARDAAERMVDLLRDRAGFDTSEGALTVAGQSFAARVTEGFPDEPDQPVPVATDTYRRFGIPRDVPDTPRTPWRRSPSTIAETEQVPASPLKTIQLADGVGETRTGSATERGTAWHLAFRVLAERPGLADRIAAATGLPEAAIAQIGKQAKALTGWLAAQGYDQLHFELPLQEIAADGSETNAILDCLAEGPKGLLIVDHKSGPCPDPDARFAGYRPQLDAYTAMVRANWPGKPLNGIAIYWMSEGNLSLSETLKKEAV